MLAASACGVAVVIGIWIVAGFEENGSMIRPSSWLLIMLQVDAAIQQTGALVGLVWSLGHQTPQQNPGMYAWPEPDTPIADGHPRRRGKPRKKPRLPGQELKIVDGPNRVHDFEHRVHFVMINAPHVTSTLAQWCQRLRGRGNSGGASC
jgi:hypothetical protein